MLAVCEGDGPNHRHDPVAFEQTRPDESSCPVCEIIDDSDDKQGEINDMASSLFAAIERIREVIEKRKTPVFLVGSSEEDATPHVVVMSMDEVNKWLTEIDGIHTDLENFNVRD